MLRMIKALFRITFRCMLYFVVATIALGFVGDFFGVGDSPKSVRTAAVGTISSQNTEDADDGENLSEFEEESITVFETEWETASETVIEVESVIVTETEEKSITELETEEICAAHDYVQQLKKATKKKRGSIATVCSNCGEIKETESIPKVKSVKLSATSYTYNKKSHKPKVKVYDENGSLIDSNNYTVKYSKNTKSAGKHTVKVTLKNQYKGTISRTYKIKKQTQKLKRARKTYTKRVGNRSFKIKVKRTRGNGKLSYRSSNTRVATVDSSGRVYIKGKGTATITVTAAGTKNYKKATKTVRVRVKAKKTVRKRSSVSSSGHDVLITPTGSCYHNRACGPGNYYWASWATARARGLRACQRCY